MVCQKQPTQFLQCCGRKKSLAKTTQGVVLSAISVTASRFSQEHVPLHVVYICKTKKNVNNMEQQKPGKQGTDDCINRSVYNPTLHIFIH